MAGLHPAERGSWGRGGPRQGLEFCSACTTRCLACTQAGRTHKRSAASRLSEKKEEKPREKKYDRREPAGFLCVFPWLFLTNWWRSWWPVPGSRIWEETQDVLDWLAGHGCNTVDDVRSRAPLSPQAVQSTLAVIPPEDSQRELTFPQPGGGMGRGASRRAMPDPVVAQRREDAASAQQQQRHQQQASRKCGGRKTAPFNDIPERELDAWVLRLLRLQTACAAAAAAAAAAPRPSHRPIHDSVSSLVNRAACHLPLGRRSAWWCGGTAAPCSC